MASRRRRSVVLAGMTGALLTVMGTATSASAATTYPIAPGLKLNVRSGPGTSYPIVRVLPEGSYVAILCQSPGTTVSGYYGTSNIWDCIGSDEFISDTYVKTGSDGYIRPRCGS